MGTSSFVLLAALYFADGRVIKAVGEGFATEEQCYKQALHDIREMKEEADHLKALLPGEELMEIRLSCEEMEGHDGHKGYIPLKEYYGN